VIRAASHSPDTPTPPGSLDHVVVSLERIPCSGFIFVAVTITLAQTCNALLAALLSFRLSMLIFSERGTNRGTIFGSPAWGAGVAGRPKIGTEISTSAFLVPEFTASEHCSGCSAPARTMC
jgi:hypothetical protein